MILSPNPAASTLEFIGHAARTAYNYAKLE